MHFFYYLCIFLMFNRMARSFKMTTLRDKWRTTFIVGQVAAFLAFGTLDKALSDEVNLLIGSFLLFAVVYYIRREEDFKIFRPYAESHYPMIAAGVITFLVWLIAPSFYEDKEWYFVIPIMAGFVWVLSRLAASKKQREELRFFAERNTELDRLVNERTAELTRQKEELEKTVELLQTTQEQLIQSEKLASLGELTAGIAHEIQNPLNFVNNFADVSNELIDEMDQELEKGDLEEVRAIAKDIKQNLEKISHHGKRADSIVKGMLQHSRASTGQKEPVNINAVADEYLRLAYHGLRAKDKSFNAELVTHFAEPMRPAQLIPQDIGRVLLNLFTNAFYAVHQKQKTLGATFKPRVEVITAVSGNNIVITVNDNGTGIPEAIRDKIMQPFFTTKPTGEGTGLGLSLSYDIVVKGHGGKLDVQSTEGEGTSFTIILPI